MFPLYHSYRTLFFSAAFFCTTISYSASWSTKPTIIRDYEVNAALKYSLLMKSIPTIAVRDDAFWQIGMAVEILLGHCQKLPDQCREVGKIALEIFRIKTHGDKKWWYDDFGWWGNSFVQLYEITHDTAYLDAAHQSFSSMQPAKQAWTKSMNIKKMSQTPLFDHGCYNADLPAETKTFEGIQNTVTNAQYLRLSLGLFQVSYAAYVKNPSEQRAQQAHIHWFETLEQFQWFSNWFGQGLLNKGFAGEHHLLVEERVNKYMSQAAEPNYAANRFWTGDQGLIMDIWSRLHTIKQNLQKYNPLNLNIEPLKGDVESIALGIAKGVKSRLTTASHTFINFFTQGQDQFPFGDTCDYACGPAVFQSAMTQRATHHDALKQKFQGDAYQIIVKACADWAMTFPTPLAIENMDSFMMAVNNLAALSAAIELYQGN